MTTVAALSLVLSILMPTDWSPERLAQALQDGTDLSAGQTPHELTRWFGGEEKLAKGARPIAQGRWVAVACTAPAKSLSVTFASDAEQWPAQGLSQSGFDVKLRQVGDTRLWVGAFQVEDGTSFVGTYATDGKVLGQTDRIEVYGVPPEALSKPDAPKGRIEQQPRLTSQVFGGTWHDWWVYTPPAFDPEKESDLVVFQDGQWAHTYVPTFFDNLCTWGGLEQTVVVCVTPGTFPDGKSDRSREYDTLSDAYSRFLLEEVLPSVEKKFKVTQDPMRRCVAGLSSGGICSFTVAWNRPDKFGLVMSWIGSFTNIASGGSDREGGHNYPALIRKTEKKPIRVFLQDGANDLDNVHGNWWLSNLQMAKALAFKGYDLKTVWGLGGHNDLQGRATMPDALRWLFRRKA